MVNSSSEIFFIYHTINKFMVLTFIRFGKHCSERTTILWNKLINSQWQMSIWTESIDQSIGWPFKDNLTSSKFYEVFQKGTKTCKTQTRKIYNKQQLINFVIEFGWFRHI